MIRKTNSKIKVALFFITILGPSLSIYALEPIRIATGDWAPYLGKKLKEKGMANHIIHEAFKASGVEVKWGFFPWSRALKVAKFGRDWDATSIWYGTMERKNDFHLSDPVMNIGHVFFHLKSKEFDWKSFDDLKKYRIGITKDYSYGKEMDRIIKKTPRKFQRILKDELNLKKLLKGKIDLFPIDPFVGQEKVRKLEKAGAIPKGSLEKLSFHKKYSNKAPTFILFSRKGKVNMPLYVEKFNEGLKKIRENGVYDKIFQSGLKGEYSAP